MLTSQARWTLRSLYYIIMHFCDDAGEARRASGGRLLNFFHLTAASRRQLLVLGF
jgi:hypothetical protein